MGRKVSFAVAVGLAALGCTREKPRPFEIKSEVAAESPAFPLALYQTTGVWLLPGHQVEVINDGRVFDVIEEEVRKARVSVNLVVFIWRPGQPSDRLIAAVTERARAGVKCRVLVDPMGSKGFEAEVAPKLQAAGCRTHVFRPLPADENLARNHRKIVVVDGKVGITGGFGIQEPWLGDGNSEKEWRDTNVRVRGPAVLQMQQAFANNWQEAAGQLLPPEDFPEATPCGGAAAGATGSEAAFVSSTANPEVTIAERITQLFVQSATKRLWIAQAYFTPNEVLRKQLVAKARAGVDVRVIAPGDKNDHPEITLVQRSTYDELIPAGIRIWEYEPAMLHSKTMLVDDDLVLIGSINYDPLSFNLLEEGALVVRDPKIARKLEQDFLDDVTRAREQKRGR